MSDPVTPSFPDFGKFVPGFDFLQNLTQQAAASTAQKSSAMPGLGHWVAPTLNVEDLEKRIQELKAVQFWLDQNATALKATIQALEVQKMTLATLKGMNFNMGELANAFAVKVADAPAAGAPPVADKARTFSGLEIPPSSFQAGPSAAAPQEPEETPDELEDMEEQADEPEDIAPVTAKSSSAKPAKPAASAASGVVDPMQWWGSLTQQFQTIAAQAMKDAASRTAPDAAPGAPVGLAKDAMKSATDMAKGLAESATKTVTDGARAAMSNALRSTQAWPTPQPAKTSGAGKTASRLKPAPQAKAAKPAASGRKPARKPG